MTYRLLYKLLHDSADIRNRVGSRIFAENAPAKTLGECVIIRHMSGSHEYHLAGESDSANPTIQLDCYAETPDRAATLGELVRLRLSGYSGTVTILVDGAETDVVLNEIEFISDRVISDSPQDASDRWVHRFSTDLQLFFTQSVPTLV